MSNTKAIQRLVIVLGMIILLIGGLFFDGREYTHVWTKDMIGISEIKDGDYTEKVRYCVTSELGLEKGTYNVTVYYEVEKEGSYVDAISYWQKQTEDIEYAPYYMKPGENKGTFRFTLKENVDDLSIRFWYGGSGDLSLNGIVLESDIGYTDYYYCGLVVCFIVLCMFIQLKRTKNGKFYCVMVWGSIFIVSLPLLKNGIALGWDMIFHIDRIEGIYRALQGGSFPVRIQAAQFGGYGYAASIFYPDMFLYIPALFRFLGMSLSAVNELFLFLIQIATGWVMYYSAQRIFHNTKIASLAAVFYIFATYRVFNIYSNYALGANIAAIFLPLVVLGIYELIEGDKNNWIYLVIGCTGVFQSHIISTLFVAMFGGLIILVSVSKIIREKRISAFLKACVSIVFLNLWFLIPFLQFQKYRMIEALRLESMVGVTIEQFLGIDRIYRYLGLSEASMLMDYRYNVILVVWIGVCIAVVSWIKNRKDTPNVLKGAMLTMFIAVLLVGDWFPWDKVSSFKWSGFIQFPVRFCMVIEVMGSMIAAYGFSRIQRYNKMICVLVCCWCIVSYSDIAEDYMEADAFVVAGRTVNTYLPQEEYMYQGTEKDLLLAGAVDAINMTYSDYSKVGTTIYMSIVNKTESDQILEVPLLYYPGYAAELDGVRLAVSMGRNNVVRICVPGYSDGQLKIWYRGFTTWYIANAISLFAWMGLGAYIVIRRKKKNDLCLKLFDLKKRIL